MNTDGFDSSAAIGAHAPKGFILRWSPATWRQIALTAWIVLAIAACVKTIIDPESHTVYTAFSHACRDWWSGTSLYENRAYYYSPTFALLMTPFAIWPDWLGGVLWNLASVGLVAWSCGRFFREVLCRRDAATTASSPTPRWGLLPPRYQGQFQLLVMIGTVRSIWSGQSNAILVGLVLLAAVAIVRREWWRAALLLAAPVYIKIWPIVAAGLFAAQWPKRLIARGAVAACLLGLLPFFTKSPSQAVESYRQWYHCLADRQTADFRFTGYRDAWTIWEQIHKPVDKHAYTLLQLAAAAGALAWCVWQRARNSSPALIVTYTVAMWTIWQLLLGPGTERLTYNIIAPALAWAVLAAYRSRRGRAWITLTYVTTFLLGVGGVERALIKIVPAATALEPLGVLMFLGWLLWHASASATAPQIDRRTPTVAELSRARSPQTVGAN